MKRIRSLKSKIMIPTLVSTAVLGIIVLVLNYLVVKYYIIEKAKKQLQGELKVAHLVIAEQVLLIEKTLLFTTWGDNVEDLKKASGIDYILVIPQERAADSKDDIIKEVASERKSLMGLRVLHGDELSNLGGDLVNKAQIAIRNTPRARPSTERELTSAMTLEFARPLKDKEGRYRGVLCAGRLINRDIDLIKRIHDYVFGETTASGTPFGTVTIFLDDVRIATNVLDNEGNLALGTCVSANVYERVVREGQVWVDRAFVVTDWYLTAYEPLRDVKGKIIGILYVGILEKPYRDLEFRILSVLVIILLAGIAVTIFLSYMIAGAISSPVKNVLVATEKIAGGEYDHTLEVTTRIEEMNSLAESFNSMAEKLNEREQSLKISNDALKERESSLEVSNEKLAALNKSYLDLLGFVAHELKGILATTMLNAYTVRDGFLGMINFKQRKALDAVVRNLDYFDATVKNFLNLSRLEKGEMTFNKKEHLLREDIFEGAVEDIEKPAAEKGMNIENTLEEGVRVFGDRTLLQIVANNLVGNAVKYGIQGGAICLTSRITDTSMEVEVYNDGRPITDAEKDRLFKKFSRLDARETKKAKGTGLGLYITKQIVEQHGGSIRVESREKGNAFIITLERGVASADTDGKDQA
ncbi:MAG: cache domain-containing protein [Vulcanimicrobiota bacterium]